MNEIADTAVSLARAAWATNHRRALVVAGGRAWCVEAATAAITAAALQRVLWVSDAPPEGAWALAASHAHGALGREVDAVAYDAHCGFDLDAFGAVSGIVRGGGLLLLLVPPLSQWPHFSDPDYARITVAGYEPADVTGRFLRRLVRVIRRDPDLLVCAQGELTPQVIPSRAPAAAAPQEDDECRTPDQRRAVEALVRVATGRRRRPLVLTSDRGRGKSAALGIASAHLLRQGIQHIIVTGPRLDAVEQVFSHAGRLLPTAHRSRAAVHFNDARIEFQPPDALAHQSHPAQLLVVDEAAAIPAPLLERLLERYSRIAFATTVHGYEGTGRGFAVRFNRVLDIRTPQWKAVRLETPIRWAPDDPLERFVLRALLLDASAAPDDAVAGASVEHVTVERLDRDELVQDEATLSEIFGLLVLAHYRTRPFDLRLLLDGPNVSVYVMRYCGHVVGTALVAAEGGFDVQTAWRVWAGYTRPHGHLIPEALAAHVGLELAPTLRCARIMRIAVHPAAQCRGLGTILIERIAEQTRVAGIDYIGSSFGATDELLRFWARSDFLTVRLSMTRGAASGAYSSIVLRPLSDSGHALVKTAQRRFREQLPHQLADPLRELEPVLAARFLRETSEHVPPILLEVQDWHDLAAFAFGKRAYEACIAAVWQLANAALCDPASEPLLIGAERDVLVLKVLQKRSWKAVASALALAGRGDVIALLRGVVGRLVMHYGNDGVRAEARRLCALWHGPREV